jgi:hypothetical protein
LLIAYKLANQEKIYLEKRTGEINECFEKPEKKADFRSE